MSLPNIFTQGYYIYYLLKHQSLLALLNNQLVYTSMSLVTELYFYELQAATQQRDRQVGQTNKALR